MPVMSHEAVGTPQPGCACTFTVATAEAGRRAALANASPVDRPAIACRARPMRAVCSLGIPTAWISAREALRRDVAG
jgi:hypothetical protein